MLKITTLPRCMGSKLWQPAWAATLACLLAWLCLAQPTPTNAANFTALLDRDQITLGDSVILTLKFDGGEPVKEPIIQPLPNMAIAGPTRSEAHTISFDGANAVRTYIVTYVYELTPRKAGNSVIPAITTTIDGQTFTSRPITLKVAEAGHGQSNVGGAYLRLVVNKNEVYLGEILPVDVQLYFQALQGGEMPHLNEEGFLLGKMLQPNQTTTVINGVQYNLASLKTFVVPAKVGKLDLGPATMSVNVPRSNARNYFNQLVDWQHVTLQSDPQPLNVLPLPKENVPPNFSGAVGNFAMSVAASPTNIAVGDPITVKIQITGQGALENLTLPAQAGWQQFKTYPPTSEFQPADQLGITGAKTFAWTVVPESMDVKELPPFVFSFFDPDQKNYRTLTQAAVPLIVRPSAASLPPTVFNSNANPADNAAPAQDIAPIKTRAGFVAQIQPALIQQPWFLALQTLPVLAWLVLLIHRRQREKLANNPRLLRQRQVEKTVRAGLKDLRQFADANDAESFFATVFRLLQEQLGERLDLPASAITESALNDRLQPLGVLEEQLAALHALFQTCNQARYARQSTNQELLSLIPQVESAINDLKKIKI